MGMQAGWYWYLPDGDADPVRQLPEFGGHWIKLEVRDDGHAYTASGSLVARADQLTGDIYQTTEAADAKEDRLKRRQVSVTRLSEHTWIIQDNLNTGEHRSSEEEVRAYLGHRGLSSDAIDALIQDAKQ